MSTILLPKELPSRQRRGSAPIRVAQSLIDLAPLPAAGACELLETSSAGLTTEEALARLEKYGPNVVAGDGRKSLWILLWHAFVNPLVLLLAVLAAVSLATGDLRSAIVMSLMIALGVSIKLVQEAKADHAAEKLKAMISITAAVVRDGEVRELPVSQLVVGDVVKLAAGDMIPADVRILTAKDLFVSQSALTGESFPVEKFDVDKGAAAKSPLELDNIAFLGTSVESGAAAAVALRVGVRGRCGRRRRHGA
jgi:Mg2+-importing ATPase